MMPKKSPGQRAREFAEALHQRPLEGAGKAFHEARVDANSFQSRLHRLLAQHRLRAQKLGIRFKWNYPEREAAALNRIMIFKGNPPLKLPMDRPITRNLRRQLRYFSIILSTGESRIVDLSAGGGFVTAIHQTKQGTEKILCSRDYVQKGKRLIKEETTFRIRLGLDEQLYLEVERRPVNWLLI